MLRINKGEDKRVAAFASTGKIASSCLFSDRLISSGNAPVRTPQIEKGDSPFSNSGENFALR